MNATYEEKDNRNHDWKRWISVFFWSRYIINFCECFLCWFVGWIWVQSDAWDSKRIQKYVSRNPKTNPTIQTNKISHGPPFSNDFWIFIVKFLKKKEFTLGNIHKWCLTIFDDFWPPPFPLMSDFYLLMSDFLGQFLTPLPL